MGVSDFKVSDKEDLFGVPGGDGCAINQIRYSLNSRGIEDDLLPWCEQRGMRVMAYSPLSGDGLVRAIRRRRGSGPAAHNSLAAAVALGWVIRIGNVSAIPEFGAAAHAEENRCNGGG